MTVELEVIDVVIEVSVTVIEVEVINEVTLTVEVIKMSLSHLSLVIYSDSDTGI